MKNKKKKASPMKILLGYAGGFKYLTYLGMLLSSIAMISGMGPYICVWLITNELIKVAPDYSKAQNLKLYGILAVSFAVLSIILYLIALMLTHVAAFRTASNIKKEGLKHLMKAPVGFFESNASGLLRNRLDQAAQDGETLLAHSLPDIAGAFTMFISMIVLMFVFDWRMGLACLFAAVVSIVAMFSMMGGKNYQTMLEQQKSQDIMSKSAAEYVRGIPVVKVFQQTLDSFKAFKKSIDTYSDKSYHYAINVCQVPQAINLTFTEVAFILLVPVVLFLAPGEKNNFAKFVSNYAFYAIFSAIISTALARLMFAASGQLIAESAIHRLSTIINAPILNETKNPLKMNGSSIEFKNVSFKYDESKNYALDNISFKVKEHELVALVGPSGGGKSTAANLISRFFDVTSGEILIGGVNIKDVKISDLMNKVSCVFQDNKLFKASILDNLKIYKNDATKEEVMNAIHLAQCDDIIEKLPNGLDTMYGEDGVYLSGGEAQRIAIARALLKDSDIVILDEATAFADPENEYLIQKAILELTKNRTVIMIAHRLSSIVNCDKIIVLKDGKIVEAGNHKELLQNKDMYYKMWNDYNTSVKWKIQTKGGSQNA